ncbi:uncharacterized protein LOC133196332 isoform X1 [Saccostrea echinata]|uniref:uncharacterized protein LOC133196332 isoform X1 n=2 Tax=Saccostrea echinata TaxID=191078 RepID=UPI002A82E208|nr:uncharacterized protein LOC133196332 isoform X1 [Saccostrea echinata]
MKSNETMCCRNRFPYMGSEVWRKLNENIVLLQQSIHLPTFLDNLGRRGLIDQETANSLLVLSCEEAVPKLLEILVSSTPSSTNDMCDALQETHPNIAEKVGLAPLPAEKDCKDPTGHSHVVKSYHAVLAISTEPHKHKEDNQLHHSKDKHSAFM